MEIHAFSPWLVVADLYNCDAEWLFKGKEAPVRKKENKTHTEQPVQLVNKNTILQ